MVRIYEGEGHKMKDRVNIGLINLWLPNPILGHDPTVDTRALIPSCNTPVLKRLWPLCDMPIPGSVHWPTIE